MRTVVWALVATLAMTPTAPAFAGPSGPEKTLFSPSELTAMIDKIVVDHWATGNECEAAVEAPWYVPSTTSNRPIGKDEVMLPHPSGACMEIDLPDRLTAGFPKRGRGWVRIAPQTQVVYSYKDKAPVRLAKCDNRIYAERPFGKGKIQTNPFEHMEKTEVNEASPGTPATLGRDGEGLVLPRRDRRSSHDEDEEGFMGRHWPKVVTASVLALAGIAVWKGLFRQTQETRVCVYSTAQCIER